MYVGEGDLAAAVAEAMCTLDKALLLRRTYLVEAMCTLARVLSLLAV